MPLNIERLYDLDTTEPSLTSAEADPAELGRGFGEGRAVGLETGLTCTSSGLRCRNTSVSDDLPHHKVRVEEHQLLKTILVGTATTMLFTGGALTLWSAAAQAKAKAKAAFPASANEHHNEHHHLSGGQHLHAHASFSSSGVTTSSGYSSHHEKGASATLAAATGAGAEPAGSVVTGSTEVSQTTTNSSDGTSASPSDPMSETTTGVTTSASTRTNSSVSASTSSLALTGSGTGLRVLAMGGLSLVTLAVAMLFYAKRHRRGVAIPAGNSESYGAMSTATRP